MRRKNRKWVALAAVLYLFVMWCAFRWGSNLRGQGDILLQREREAIRKQAEERAKQAAASAQPQVEPTGESQLAAAGPAYVAVHYDARHVVFLVATDMESRFSISPRTQSGEFTKVPAPLRPSAQLAGLQELWEPDSSLLHFFPKIFQKAQPGDLWNMDLSSDAMIPVSIERVIVAPTGCSLGLGFVALVLPDEAKAFAASRSDYFLVRRVAVPVAQTPSRAHIGEIEEWEPESDFYQHIEEQLTTRMKQELAVIDPSAVAQADEASRPAIAVGVQKRAEWTQTDRALAQDEAKLEYDFRSFHLTPDGAPRLYVRARWTLAGKPIFLMTAWFKTEQVDPAFLKADSSRSPLKPVLLFADAHWSRSMRESKVPPGFGGDLEFEKVLNEFDADQDGWAELLIYSQEGKSATITPYLYADQALVPLKTQFRREERTAESCLNQ